MSSPPTLQYNVGVGDLQQRLCVRLVATAPDGTRTYGLRVADGPERLVEVSRPEALVMNLLMDGRSVEAGAVPQGDGYLIDVDGVNHEVSVVDPRKAALRAGAADGAAAVRTQMPGRVVRVLVEAGAAVSKGQPLVVVEAMKMENELKAPRDGVVARLLVSAGDLVEGKATLIELA